MSKQLIESILTLEQLSTMSLDQFATMVVDPNDRDLREFEVNAQQYFRTTKQAVSLDCIKQAISGRVKQKIAPVIITQEIKD